MVENGPHLRVSKPVTTNGIIPKIGPDGRIVYKFYSLPLTARTELEKLNRKMDETLRYKIDVVYPDQDPVLNQQKIIQNFGMPTSAPKPQVATPAPAALTQQEVETLVQKAVAAQVDPIMAMLQQIASNQLSQPVAAPIQTDSKAAQSAPISGQVIGQVTDDDDDEAVQQSAPAQETQRAKPGPKPKENSNAKAATT